MKVVGGEGGGGVGEAKGRRNEEEVSLLSGTQGGGPESTYNTCGDYLPPIRTEPLPDPLHIPFGSLTPLSREEEETLIKYIEESKAARTCKEMVLLVLV